MTADFSTHALSLRAGEIFQSSGYRTARVTLPQTEATVLVAESPYAVTAIAAADQWRELAEQADQLGTEFANWALSQEPRAKQWDLYLILLATQPVTSDQELARIELLADDTRYIRRLIRHGVSADRILAEAETALAALLPLSLPDRISQRDPLAALTEALKSQGVQSDLASQTVEQFIVRKEAVK